MTAASKADRPSNRCLAVADTVTNAFINGSFSGFKTLFHGRHRWEKMGASPRVVLFFSGPLHQSETSDPGGSRKRCPGAGGVRPRWVAQLVAG
eukprot:Skav209990  [mRNA]  locus=scaffold1046:572215:577625:+ [translate_table: standard]